LLDGRQVIFFFVGAALLATVIGACSGSGGSGIASYDIFVSTDGAVYLPLLQGTALIAETVAVGIDSVARDLYVPVAGPPAV
jgi:hypothetical protein